MKFEGCVLMKILVLNCGSSTLKFQLIEVDESNRSQRKLARGIVDRIRCQRPATGSSPEDAAAVEKPTAIRSHEDAVGLVISWLQSTPQLGHVFIRGAAFIILIGPFQWFQETDSGRGLLVCENFQKLQNSA